MKKLLICISLITGLYFAGVNSILNAAYSEPSQTVVQEQEIDIYPLSQYKLTVGEDSCWIYAYEWIGGELIKHWQCINMAGDNCLLVVTNRATGRPVVAYGGECGCDFEIVEITEPLTGETYAYIMNWETKI